jgi:hypothetical protein
MARIRKLTWDAARKRWKKIYRGHVLYLGNGDGKSDETSYRCALEQFGIRKAEIDAEIESTKPYRVEYETAMRLRQAMLYWLLLERENASEYDAVIDHMRRENEVYHQTMGAPSVSYLLFDAEHDRLAKEIEQLNSDFRRVRPPELNKPGQLPIDPLAYRPIHEQMQWMERVDALQAYQKWTGTTDHCKTVAGNIESFLSVKKALAQSGQRKPGGYAIVEHRLGTFKLFAGQTFIDSLNGKTLATFHAHLIQQIEQGNISPSYAAGGV